MFREEYRKPISEVAAKLGVPYDWLHGLIGFESNFNPLAKNPGSSARGLIQVIDSTARSVFGVSDSLTLINQYPDFASQMHSVVYPYLKPMMPYPTKQSLYMAVFFPLARRVPPETTFKAIYQSRPELFKPDWLTAYNKFASVNPNIITVQDYVDKVDRIIRIAGVAVPSPKRMPFLWIAVTGTAAGVITAIVRK